MRKVTVTTLAVAAILVVYLTIWPTSLGGRSSFVAVSGESMSPRFHTGDLVWLLRTGDYAVGDVVAYDTDTGRVIHRIIGVDDAGFVTQGDNNPEPDPYRPNSDDVVGEELAHVPAVGRTVAGLGVLVAGWPTFIILGTMVGMATAAGTGSNRRRRQRVKASEHPVKADQPAPQRVNSRLSGPPPVGAAATIIAGALAITAITGAAIAWRTTPTTVTTTTTETWRATSEFAYTARAASPSVAYPTGSVGPVEPSEEDRFHREPPTDDGSIWETADNADASEGTPAPTALYTSEIEQLDITWRAATSGELAGLEPIVSVEAVLRTNDGWTSSETLREMERFAVGDVQTTTTIDFGEYRELVARVADVAVMEPPPYEIDVLHRLRFEGSDAEIEERFSISVDGRRVAPETDLARTTVDTTPTRTETRNTALGLDVANARPLLSAAALALIVITGLLAAIVWGWRSPEHVRILRRHRASLIAAQGLPSGADVVMVSSFNDLRRLARTDDLPVLYSRSGRAHRFVLPTANMTYEYRIPVEAVLEGSSSDEFLDIVASLDTEPLTEFSTGVGSRQDLDSPDDDPDWWREAAEDFNLPKK